MSKVKVLLKYEGSALNDKKMDIAELSPSLIALSDLFKLINKQLNRESRDIKVYAEADVEQHCFELGIIIAQTMWENTKHLIQSDSIATAEKIASIIGIASCNTPSLYDLIKFLKGKEVKNVLKITEKNGNKKFKITAIGGEAIEVVKDVYNSYKSPEIRQKIIDTTKPLQSEGYDSIQFYNGNTIYKKILKDDIPKEDGSDLPEIEPSNEHKSIIETTIKIKKPAYEGQSKWLITYKTGVEANMDDKDWLNKFQSRSISAPPGSSLKVSLEEIYSVNEDLEIIEKPTYTIKKVHEVILPQKQDSLEFENEQTKNI